MFNSDGTRKGTLLLVVTRLTIYIKVVIRWKYIYKVQYKIKNNTTIQYRWNLNAFWTIRTTLFCRNEFRIIKT